MPEVKLRPARFEDHAAVAALETSQGLACKPFEEWRSLWVGNPTYEKLALPWPIGWVIETGGRVVGCTFGIPLTYTFRGRELLAAAGHGWAVEDQYRGYALMLLNEQFSRPHVDLFIDTTVNANAATAFLTFGSLRTPVGDWANAALFVTRPRGFTESALRIKGFSLPTLLSYPAGFALSVKDLFGSRALPKNGIAVNLSHDFDQRFDVFWQNLAKSSEVLLAVRSREVLRWHFNSALGTQRLWVMTAERDGKLAAYAIFQRRDEPKYGLKRMRLVDFQASSQQDEYCAAFMRTAARECRSQGIHVLEHVGCDLPKTRVFDQYAPYRRKLPGWCSFYLTEDDALADLLAKPDAWAPSSFDGDSSL